MTKPCSQRFSTFGNRLRIVLADLGFGRDGLYRWYEDVVGFDVRNLRRWLAGNNLPSPRSWQIFCQALEQSYGSRHPRLAASLEALTAHLESLRDGEQEISGDNDVSVTSKSRTRDFDAAVAPDVAANHSLQQADDLLDALIRPAIDLRFADVQVVRRVTQFVRQWLDGAPQSESSLRIGARAWFLEGTSFQESAANIPPYGIRQLRKAQEVAEQHGDIELHAAATWHEAALWRKAAEATCSPEAERNAQLRLDYVFDITTRYKLASLRMAALSEQAKWHMYKGNQNALADTIRAGEANRATLPAAIRPSVHLDFQEYYLALWLEAHARSLVVLDPAPNIGMIETLAREARSLRVGLSFTLDHFMLPYSAASVRIQQNDAHEVSAAVADLILTVRKAEDTGSSHQAERGRRILRAIASERRLPRVLSAACARCGHAELKHDHNGYVCRYCMQPAIRL